CSHSFLHKNKKQALSKMNDNNRLKKYHELARILTGNPGATAQDGINWVNNLIQKLDILKLSQFGLNESNFEVLVSKAKAASSMKGNPVVLQDDGLTLILGKSV
ncbi:MAG: hypothetical protein ACOC1D_05715, partial [Prolixibacteraceae bacterium]